jgi:hypothetical protein
MTYLVSDIERAVSQKYSLSKAQLRGPSRVRVIARPRQIAMYLARQLTKASYPVIGRHFGGRDHTTILHGYRRIAQLMRETNTMAGEVEDVREIVLTMAPARQRLLDARAATHELVMSADGTPVGKSGIVFGPDADGLNGCRPHKTEAA